jgi:predicted TPR repeat methyltransferase
VVAADVFVYSNELTPILTNTARVLTPAGIVAFTAETHAGDGVELLPTLRFAHGEPYLREVIAAARLNLLSLEHADIRTEKSVPVAGLVVVAANDRGMAEDQ